ncbi:MAG: hypothetical protein KC994_19195, partial [Candidatus Omnitrophica bacterium]|nr:hypothetical protein [Candidatus Omnitrophota bacterium]
PIFLFPFTIMMGRFDLFQWISLLWLVFFVQMILSLVWLGRTSGLVKVSVVLLICGVLAYYFIPPVWKGEKDVWATNSDFTDPFTWVGQGADKIAVIEGRYDGPSKLAIYSTEGVEMEMDLGLKRCEFLPAYSDDILAVKKSDWRVSGSSEEILLCDINNGKLEILPFDPQKISLFYSSLFKTPFWSPDRDSLLLNEVTRDASGEGTYTLAVGNRRTGEIQKFEGLERFFTGDWLGEEEIRAVTVKNYNRRTSAATDEYYVRLHHLDAQSGSHEVIADYPLSASMYCWPVPGGEYALVVAPASKESADQSATTYLWQLIDDYRIPLPPKSEAYGGRRYSFFPYAWSVSAKRLVYLADIEGDPHVTVVDPFGFKATLPLEEGQLIGSFSISPDGEHVIFDSYFPNDYHLQSMVQIHHWKVGEDVAEKVSVTNLDFSFLFDLFDPEKPPMILGFLPSNVQWSPDSTKFATWGMMEAEGLSSRLWVYHLGGG